MREDGRSAIWGGATLGLFVGLILGFFVGTYWMTVLYAVGIGAAAGFLSNVLAWIGYRLSRRGEAAGSRDEPVTLPPQPRLIATADLTVADLPQPDAPSNAYHRFATTFNGQQEMGSWRVCGKTADESLERWRETRELPDTLEELRACLFFEHPHFHRDRDDSDKETLEYERAIVGKLRSLLRTTAGKGAPSRTQTPAG